MRPVRLPGTACKLKGQPAPARPVPDGLASNLASVLSVC
eukprot:SAG22_NODE_5468_length_1008_cov_1.359736_2_plen_38_part_01